MILAVIALGLAIQEVFFGVTPGWAPIVTWAQCAVVILLLIKWCASLHLAGNRKEHLMDPRTMGGLTILLVCFLAFSPGIAHILARSPSLKIVRIAPVIVFGFLSARPLFISKEAPTSSAPAEDIGFQRIEVQSNDGIAFEPVSKEEFEAWVANPDRQGCRCAIAQHAGAITGNLVIPSIPATLIRSALAATSYPRVSRLGATFVFSGSLPMASERDTLLVDVQTVPFAFLCTSKSFVLAESHPSIGIALGELLKDKHLLPDQPLESRLALGLFSLLIARYEEVADRMASDVRLLMMLPMGRGGEKAYMAGFSLQRSLARLKSDMWRLGQIFDRLEKGRLTLPFEEENFMAMYEGFSDACDFISEAFSQSHDAASSTIDLRINLASFHMSRFMGLLAVATAVGIIPTTICGFLGMNIQGPGFPVSLGNVVFWAVMLIVLALYFLKTRGWLRF